MNQPQLYLGIDVGTSGIRACIIDSSGREKLLVKAPWPDQARSGQVTMPVEAETWFNTLVCLLEICRCELDLAQVSALAIDGTSATLLVTDQSGQPLAPALPYHDTSCIHQAELLNTIAPLDSAARGASSSLAKLLFLYKEYPEAALALHQSDWLTGALTGRWGISDYNNALKLGFDIRNLEWPEWIQELGLPPGLLPKIVAPGTPVGKLAPSMARLTGLNPETLVVAGTTDSTAAVRATGISVPGEAVTSLGSTLAMKILSETCITAPEYGVYSHRYRDHWLVGGASNAGAAVLQQYFDSGELDRMTAKLQPEKPLGLDYYPLPCVGERFPVSNPELEPRLTPRPDNDVEFFQAILEGLTAIETRSYEVLQKLGAPVLTRVISVGGGSRNPAWTRMREQSLGVPVINAEHDEAAYGAALIALGSDHDKSLIQR